MSDSTEAILSLSQTLGDLQKRLAEVETERASLKQRIHEVKEQLAAAVPQPYGTTTRSQVLWILRREPHRAFAPVDLCSIMGSTAQNAVRVVLLRLLREGAVKRVRHGRYSIA